MEKRAARLTLDAAFPIGKIDPRIYGSFIEHMERVVYEGIYEPDHPNADEDGFRRDIIELTRELQIPFVRYPGGNFLSGYNWEDGVGPKEKRPVRKDLAWCAYETNQVGTDEFMRWLEKVGAECNMAVNLGTRGIDAARNLVEYMNGDGTSSYSQMRIQNGRKEPYKVKTWCLGNEMDGDWQIGHKTADEYGRLAHEAAKLMKKTDPDIELVACGSSNTTIDTYPAWDATVMDYLYGLAEYISLHAYYTIVDNTMEDYLASALDMSNQIEAIIATADHIKAKHHGKKDFYLSFDEWGLWNEEETANRKAWTYRWEDANAISEGSYTFADALVTGSIMNALINHCDRVKIACQAQLVNHLSLFNCAKGGRSWRQTIFYPFLHASKYGRGTALQTSIQCASYETERHGAVPMLDASAVLSEDGRALTLFVMNRDRENIQSLECVLNSFGEAFTPVEHIAYEGYDLNAKNSLAVEDVVPTTRNDICMKNNAATVDLKPASWNVLRFTR